MASDCIYIFYGHSGETPKSAQTPRWPDGMDHNKSFMVAAEAMANIVKHWFTSTNVYVRQAWSKEILFRELERATEPIRQVHIMAHGVATQVSLAYYYDHGERLAARVRKFNADKGPSKDLPYKQWAAEDALIVGYLKHRMDRKQLAKIKGNHTRDACWQIWGCFSGEPEATLGTSDDIAQNVYYRRFALGQKTVPGIAVEIAKMIGVTCTAAVGRGLTFWCGTGKGNVRLISRKENPVKPFWLWLDNTSRWVSYGPDGKAMNETIMFQWTWNQKDISGKQLPQWLIDGYIY